MQGHNMEAKGGNSMQIPIWPGFIYKNVITQFLSVNYVSKKTMTFVVEKEMKIRVYAGFPSKHVCHY